MARGRAPPDIISPGRVFIGVVSADTEKCQAIRLLALAGGVGGGGGDGIQNKQPLGVFV